MDHVTLAGVLVLLVYTICPVASTLITYAPPPCNKNETRSNGKCFLTVACENCSHAEVKCYEDKQLQPLYQSQFKDGFCGPHGVVVVKYKVGQFHTLKPLTCRNESCPDGSHCVKNPDQEKLYCCSHGSDANSKCVRLDLLRTVKKPFKQRIVDENGDPVNISSITIVLDNTDVRCLQGWTYSFKSDTVYMSNGCRVQFQICYESGTPLLSNRSGLLPPGQICDRVHLLSRASRPAERTFSDVFDNPLTIRSVHLLEQISQSKCEEGKSYIFYGSAVRATGGCQGIFNICYDSDTNVTSSTGNLTGITCRNVIIKCKKNQHVTRNIVDESNKQVTVVSMGVVRQISQAPCVERKNFHFQGSRVVVKHGCHAEFEICYTSSSNVTNTSVTDTPGETCETVDLSSTPDLPAEKTFLDDNGHLLSIRSVEFLEPFSVIRCVQGITFTFSRTLVRATSGCRATFKVCYGPDESLYQTTTTVSSTTGETCETVDLSSTPELPAEKTFLDDNGHLLSIRSVEFLESFSVIRCVQGITFTFSRSQVRATSGCRATFKVCYGPDNSLHQTTTTVTPTTVSEPACKHVTLQGLDRERIVKTFRGSENSSVQVTSMDLVQQLSSVQCVEWLNYYFEGNTVLVKGGCFAKFQVCYKEQIAITPPPLIEESKPGHVCRFINLFSSRNGLAQRTITDVRGKNATMRNMTLVFESSKYACVKGESFNFSESGITASRGCGGIFRICYDVEVINFTSPQGQVCDKEVILLSTITRADEKSLLDMKGKPLAISSLVLVEQYSDIRCVEGHSYNVSGCVVRATDGCRGVFKICHVATERRQQENKMSTPVVRRQTCDVIDLLSKKARPATKIFTDDWGNPLTIRSLTLLEEYSDDRCVEGDTYDVTGFKVRTSDGCKGTFKVCYDKAVSITGPETHQTGQECVTLTLRSSPDRPKVVEITDKKSKRPVRVDNVEVLKQISDVPCDEWETFEYDGSRVRALDGCEAVFKICYHKKIQPDQECVTLTLRSSPDRPKVVEITDKKSKKPVRVDNVEVLKQISDVPCEEWETFEYDGSRVRALDGCAAVFKICYHKKSRRYSKHWLYTD